MGSEKRSHGYKTRIEEIIPCLLLRSPTIGNQDKPILRDWLSRAPYTLAMSSGYFGFFAHFGILEALEDSGLLPARASGSSAGALAIACWASGCAVSKLKTRLFGLTKADFWDPSLGFGLLKGLRFRQMLAEVCPVQKIEDCSVPLAISAFDLTSLSTHSLRRGSLSEAVYASCCVPFLFQPIRIGQSLYLDGGIRDRPGLAGIPASSRVLYHHLQSGWPHLKKDQGLSEILEKRPNTVAILVNDLESVSPGRISSGQQAFHQTRMAIRKALQQPIINRKIVL